MKRSQALYCGSPICIFMYLLMTHDPHHCSEFTNHGDEQENERTQVAVVFMKALELHQLAVVEDPANSLRNISLLATRRWFLCPR